MRRGRSTATCEAQRGVPAVANSHTPTIVLRAVIGFSLMAWAFVFDACVDVYHAISAKKTA